MPHAQPRVSALFDVALRPAETADQEISQSRSGLLELVVGVHWAQYLVVRYAVIESLGQPVKSSFADDFVNAARHPYYS